LRAARRLKRQANAVAGEMGLRASFARAPTGKQHGNARLVSDLLSLFAETLARLYAPPTSKAATTVVEPVQWQVRLSSTSRSHGASTLQASDQREIWLGDQVPKSRDQRMRTTTASAVAHLIPPMQHGHCSGSAHCEAAHLVLRTSLDRAKREGLPHTALFADVASAFAATTRREFLMPSLHSEAALRELAAHGASELDVRRLAASSNVGSEWGEDTERLRWTIAARGLQPWASFDGRAGVIAVGRGLAAGLPFAEFPQRQRNDISSHQSWCF
jgi:hypothetical protein